VASTPDARPSKPSDVAGALEAFGAPPGGGGVWDLALVHRSYAFEQPEPTEHNERLEFLGDAILEAVVTDLIYRGYPQLAEGEMARLRASVVNTYALAEIARDIAIGDLIKLGKGEESSGGREKSSLLANTFEALVGAAYLDGGIEKAREVLAPLFEPEIERRIEMGGRYDAKTALQEIVVRNHGRFPSYRVASTGPDHDKHFTAHVYVDAELYGVGDGRSKKEAEQNAARGALEKLADEPPLDPRDERGPDARAS
jgi:ribonuclease III